METFAQELAKQAGYRSEDDVAGEISRFHWYLKYPDTQEFCLPPIEIIPASVIHHKTDTGEVSEEVVEARIEGFVEKLRIKDKSVWKLFTKELVRVSAAHAYIPDFASISPFGHYGH